MAVTPTEDPKYLQAALPDRIVEDEVIFMDGGDAPFWPHWQRLYDRTAHHELAVFGSLSWNGDFAVDAGGSSSSFTVRIGAINAVHLYNATASKVLAYGGGTIGASKIEGGGNLGNSEWRYVYAFINAGALDFEISTTAPNASRTLKSGAPTRRLVGTFLTDSSGAPLAVTASNGCYRYRDAAVTLHTNKSTANLLTFTSALSLAAKVPSFARIVTVRLVVTRDNSGDSAVAIRVSGDTNNAGLFWAPSLASLTFVEFQIEMDVGSAREIQIATESAHTFVNVDVAGWRA